MSANTYEALNAKVGRRSFLKMAAVSTAFGVTSSFASTPATRAATEEEIKLAQFPKDGTPCLVRHSSNDMWELRYSNGKGEFYHNGKKLSNKSKEWICWLDLTKTDLNNIPE